MYQSSNGGDPLSLQCRQPEALQLECLTEHGRGLQAKQPCPRINGARRDGRSTAAQLSCAAQCSARSGCSPQQHPVPTAGLLVLPLHFSCRSNVFFSSLSFGGVFFVVVWLFGWFFCAVAAMAHFPFSQEDVRPCECLGGALLSSTLIIGVSSLFAEVVRTSLKALNSTCLFSLVSKGNDIGCFSPEAHGSSSAAPAWGAPQHSALCFSHVQERWGWAGAAHLPCPTSRFLHHMAALCLHSGSGGCCVFLCAVLQPPLPGAAACEQPRSQNEQMRADGERCRFLPGDGNGSLCQRKQPSQLPTAAPPECLFKPTHCSANWIPF